MYMYIYIYVLVYCGCVSYISIQLDGQYATHCNTLQHTATHCNTLQHTATHCPLDGQYATVLLLNGRALMMNHRLHEIYDFNVYIHLNIHIN